MKNRSGQILLIAVLILVVLLLVIPTIIFINSSVTMHGVNSQQKIKAQSIAEEAVAYGLQQLSKSGNWPYVTGGGLPANGTFAGTQGASFSVTFSSAPAAGLQSYEVGVKATALNSTGKPIPGTTLFTTFSQRTLGAKLPTGYNAGAALTLTQVPLDVTGLAVHSGPIVLYTTSPWTVSGVMDTARFPRKFSQGRISGTAYPRTSTAFPDTDNKEYWSNQSLGYPNQVNLAAYKTIAQHTQVPVSAKGWPVSINCFSAGNYTCAGYNGQCSLNNATYFDQSSCAAGVSPCGDIVMKQSGDRFFILSCDSDAHYAFTNPTAVVYVNGDAVFGQDGSMDLKSKGAFIVTGNLYISGPYGSQTMSLHMPPTASLEYPYYPANPTAWPCSAAGATCASGTTGLGPGDTTGLGTGGTGVGKPAFRGFLYVLGNLIYSPTNLQMLMVGAARVDGTVTMPLITGGYNTGGPSFELFYDDEINHNIQVNTFDLMIDNQQILP